MPMTLISTTTLGSSNANIDITSIPGTYTDLRITYLLRSDFGGYFTDNNSFTVNNSSSGYSWRRLWNVASSSGSGSSMSFGLINGSPTTSNSFTIGEMYIPNYSGSTNKSFSYDSSTETNTTTDGYYMMIYAGLWSNTSAITSIKFTSGQGNFVAGSTVSVYGILKGSGGATVS